MHPTIRIVSLLIAVATLPFLSAPALYACTAGAVFATPFLSGGARHAIAQGIWRLRWLALAIFLLYLLFNASPQPGEALARVLVLCLAVAAVQCTLHGLAPGLLADGLVRVLAPCRRLGLDTGRFARRLVLTLAAVPQVQSMIATQAPGHPAQRAAELVRSIESEPPDIGDGAPADAGPVPAIQWLWPLAVAAAGLVLLLAGGAR